jgi:hypothetical protein
MTRALSSRTAAAAALAASLSACATAYRPPALASAAPAPAAALAHAGHEEGAAPAHPAHAPLAGPDRPGYSFSPVTVPAGGVQLETGATEARAGTQTYRTVGEGLLRVGVARATELRVSGQSFASRTDAAAPAGARTARGVEDARLGVKQRLFAGHAAAGVAATSVAVIAGTTVPSGSADFGARAWQPEAVLVVNTPLTTRLSVVENLSDSYADASTTPDGHRAHRVGATVAGWYALTGRVSAFGEYAGTRLAAVGAAAAHYVDAGVTFTPVGHVQLDVRAGAGMNGVRGDRFVGAGVTRRW